MSKWLENIQKWERGVDKWMVQDNIVDSSINQIENITFPTIDILYGNYPDPYQYYCEWADNECAIRVSIALGLSGVDISTSNKWREIHKHKGSNIVHQPSAMALADWLSVTLKHPKKYSQESDFQYTDFEDKNGIIYFVHPLRGGSGPGHIDIIYDKNIGSNFYPNNKIWFWEYNNGW